MKHPRKPVLQRFRPRRRSAASLPLGYDDGGRSFPAVSVQERLGERTDDDGHAHLPLPRTVVPPLDVARVQPVLGSAAIALDPVHVPEPVALLRSVPVDAVDRLHEPPAEARLDVELPVERLHGRQPRRNLPLVQHGLPPVARHPERRRLRAALVPAAAGEGEREREEREPAHGSAFDLTAPGATARTSRPGCGPGQAWPFLAATVRFDPTRSATPGVAAVLPLSSNAVTA